MCERSGRSGGWLTAGGDDGVTAARHPASDPPHWLRKTVLFLSGQTVSLLGSMLVQYAVFWYLTITYQSGVIMMLAAVFGFLPQAVISIFGGVWADRHNRKLLIIVADAAIAADDARTRDHHDERHRRGVDHLPRARDPLRRRRHPDARRRGAAPADRARRAI